MTELKSYPVWDATTRWFHWINVLCFIALAGLGLVILNTGALAIPNPGKLLLKTLHVWVGYVFVLNLAWRFIWGFAGNHYARWRQMLPGGPGYGQELRDYLSSFSAGHPKQTIGHNPAGRIGIAILLLLMTSQAITGLVLAGTDIFYPPLGHWIAGWIAAPGVDPSSVAPYTPALYDKASYDSMRSVREPISVVHAYGFYLLAFMVMVHIAAVVMTELREGGTLVSAMFTGRKILDRPAADPNTDHRRKK